MASGAADLRPAGISIQLEGPAGGAPGADTERAPIVRAVRAAPAGQLGLALNFSIFSLSSVYSSQLPQTCCSTARRCSAMSGCFSSR